MTGDRDVLERELIRSLKETGQKLDALGKLGHGLSEAGETFGGWLVQLGILTRVGCGLLVLLVVTGTLGIVVWIWKAALR